VPKLIQVTLLQPCWLLRWKAVQWQYQIRRILHRITAGTETDTGMRIRFIQSIQISIG